VAARLDSSTAGTPDLGTPKVLLVDDRQENLLALKAVLAPIGVELIAAGSGEEALRELLLHDFAVVLLDVQMPGMDGFETAGYIRARDRNRTTPIIFVTAISKDVEHVLRGYEAGGVDYVLKPFDPAVLRSKVAVFAELERQRRARARSEALLENALEGSPNGIALVDASGAIERANPALGVLLGEAPERLVGRRLDDVLGAGELAQATAMLRVQGGTPFATEIELSRDGARVPVAALVSAVGGLEAGGLHLFVQLWDLSDRVEAERAREGLVAERAARGEAEALAQRLAKVAAIADGLESLRLTDLVGELCERLADVLGATGAAVRVLPPDRAAPAEAVHGAASAAGVALDEAIREGAPAASPDGGAIAVPLLAAGGILGGMAVSGVTGTVPEPQLRSLLTHAGERASLMLERARLFEREHHIASTLQRDLMPRELPHVPGLSLSAHFHAGGDGTDVGGDWYDTIPLPGGRLGLVVGDVAGRGVSAAARMGQLRSVARAYALEGHGPAAVVERLNLYHRALSPDDMTTLVYAVVEPDLDRLRFVSAGHPPPALIAPGEAPRLLAQASAPALGVTEIFGGSEVVVDFPPGSMLMLYTDGLVERRGEGIDRGLRRLVGALEAPAADLQALQDHVVDVCMETTACDDDVTALIVRAEPLLGERVSFTLTPDRDALAALRRMLRRWLLEAGASDAEVGAITMAANEAWQNAIEHAHRFAPVPVRISFELADDEAVITVRDAGSGVPDESDPDRGRGLELMRALMDEATLDFGSSRGGLVTLRRRIGAEDPAAAVAG
jgi:PAS domain S-box-containing protein